MPSIWQELRAQVSELATPQDGGEENRQSALAKAQRITPEELGALGRTVRDLQGRRKVTRSKFASPRGCGARPRRRWSR